MANIVDHQYLDDDDGFDVMMDLNIVDHQYLDDDDGFDVMMDLNIVDHQYLDDDDDDGFDVMMDLNLMFHVDYHYCRIYHHYVSIVNDEVIKHQVLEDKDQDKEGDVNMVN